MEFRKAYQKMLKGKYISRPCFEGVWYIDGVTNKLTIIMASGEKITEGCLDHTVKNTLANDWYVVTDKQPGAGTIELLEEMKNNCEKATAYNDVKRYDKAKALECAILLLRNWSIKSRQTYPESE